MNTNNDIAKMVWSEEAIQQLLGCTKKRLRRLTLQDDGIPSVRLERGLYVYLASDVLRWIEERKSNPGSPVTDAENGLSTP